MEIYLKYMSEPWFSLAKNNKKNIEIRLNQRSFSDIKKSDIIIWFNDDCGPDARRYLKTRIEDIYYFKDMDEIVKSKMINNIIPVTKNYSRKDGINFLKKIYPKRTANYYGIIAVKFKIVK